MVWLVNYSYFLCNLTPFQELIKLLIFVTSVFEFSAKVDSWKFIDPGLCSFGENGGVIT